MDILERTSWQKFQAMIPTIKQNVDSWRIISVRLEDEAPTMRMIKLVAERMRDTMKDWSGALFIASTREIFCFAHSPLKERFEKLKESIPQALANFKCSVRTLPASLEGLNRIDVVLNRTMFEDDGPETEIMTRRRARNEKVIMVIDDDMFMRTLLNNALKNYGRVLESVDGSDVIERYKQEVPDAVFLDIHLPGRSGVDLLHEIQIVDPEAQVVMISADSVRDNVMKATLGGARWFLGKPLTKETVSAALKRCSGFEKIT